MIGGAVGKTAAPFIIYYRAQCYLIHFCDGLVDQRFEFVT